MVLSLSSCLSTRVYLAKSALKKGAAFGNRAISIKNQFPGTSHLNVVLPTLFKWAIASDDLTDVAQLRLNLLYDKLRRAKTESQVQYVPNLQALVCSYLSLSSFSSTPRNKESRLINRMVLAQYGLQGLNKTPLAGIVIRSLFRWAVEANHPIALGLAQLRNRKKVFYVKNVAEMGCLVRTVCRAVPQLNHLLKTMPYNNHYRIDEGLALQEAAYQNNRELVALVLGGSNSSSIWSMALVRIAATAGNFPLVQFLLNVRKLDPREKGDLILVSAKSGNYEQLLFFLNGMRMSHSVRESALIAVAKKGDLSAVRALFEFDETRHKEHRPISEKTRGEAMGAAAEEGQMAVTNYLLETRDLTPECCFAAFVQVAACGNVRFLSESMMVKVRFFSSLDIAKGIWAAAKRGHYEMVQFLLKLLMISIDQISATMGVDFVERALVESAESGNLELVELILGLNQKKISERSLQEAYVKGARSGNLRLMQRLERVNHDRLPEGRQMPFGELVMRDALVGASGSRNPELVQWLLNQMGVHIISSVNINRCVEIAAETGEMKIVQLLGRIIPSKGSELEREAKKWR